VATLQQEEYSTIKHSSGIPILRKYQLDVYTPDDMEHPGNLQTRSSWKEGNIADSKIYCASCPTSDSPSILSPPQLLKDIVHLPGRASKNSGGLLHCWDESWKSSFEKGSLQAVDLPPQHCQVIKKRDGP